jgi:RNA polymerase sigma-70 factor (ECF subfamily)
MDRTELDRHLSQMSTAWTALVRAQQGVDSQAGLARAEVLERYWPAIHRYLLGATRDPDGADELHQQFALKFLRGDFRHADPNRGRFRDYLKTSLYHLVNHWRRGSRSRFQTLKDEVAEPVDEPAARAEDEAFLRIWREELLQRTWTALKERESKGGQPLYTVLRFRTDNPELNSQEVAEQLSRSLGRSLSAEWARKWVHHARSAFAELLVEDVASSLADPSADALEEELRELGLLDHCRAAIKSYRQQRSKP